MEVIKYLRENGLQSLIDTYHINAKRHAKYDNLVLLKYDQIESPKAHPIVVECRGLILDESRDWQVISRPFDRFFNHGEGHAAQIDWATAQVQEKLDGSLMTLYSYDGHWHVSSSGSPDASGPVNNDSSMTFADLFWQTWTDLGYNMPTNSGTCYMFELMTPHNRVVVPHDKSRLVLIGARCVGGRNAVGWNPYPEEFPYNVVTYWQDHPDIAAQLPEFCKPLPNWEVVRSFPITSWDECTVAAAALNPMRQEGFVVTDAYFNRVKVKSPQYVAIHHMRDGFGDRRMMDLVRTNEGSEFLQYFPEYGPLYEKIKAKYDTLVTQIESIYESVKVVESQKDFALNIQALPFKGALFALRAGKTKSAKEYLAAMSIQSFERLI